MVSLGDAMSLLMTFFVMLMAFADQDSEQLLTVLSTMQGALGAVKVGRVTHSQELQRSIEETDSGSGSGPKDGVVHGTGISADELSPVTLDRQAIHKNLLESHQKFIALGFKELISAEMLDDGVHFYIDEKALFRNDDSLTDDAHILLSGLINLARNCGNEIRLISHLLEDGTSAGTHDTWSRALRRSQNVSSFLVSDYGLDASRFGYGIQLDAPEVAHRGGMEVVLMDRSETRRVTFRQFWQERGRERGGD
jgi:hypothetical protein